MTKERRIMTTIKPNGKRLKYVARMTDIGASTYANRQYEKYGEGTKIEEYFTEQEITNIWSD